MGAHGSWPTVVPPESRAACGMIRRNACPSCPSREFNALLGSISSVSVGQGCISPFAITFANHDVAGEWPQPLIHISSGRVRPGGFRGSSVPFGIPTRLCGLHAFRSLRAQAVWEFSLLWPSSGAAVRHRVFEYECRTRSMAQRFSPAPILQLDKNPRDFVGLGSNRALPLLALSSIPFRDFSRLRTNLGADTPTLRCLQRGPMAHFSRFLISCGSDLGCPTPQLCVAAPSGLKPVKKVGILSASVEPPGQPLESRDLRNWLAG